MMICKRCPGNDGDMQQKAEEIRNGRLTRLTAAQFYNKLISICECFVWSVFALNVREMLAKMYKNGVNA